MKRFLQLSALAAAASQSAALAAPVPISGATTYVQNFDGLSTASVVWTNDSTIPGWFAQINNGTTANGSAQASDGNGTVLNGLLNLGSTGDTDRALGSKATGTGNFANIAYAVTFQNTSSSPIALSQIDYTGELWRTNTGTGTPAVAVPEDFTMFYQVSAAPLTSIISGASNTNAAAGAGFTAVGTGATWTSPTNTPVATPLDGNDGANQGIISYAVPANTIVIPPGRYLTLKWTDTNEAGTDGYQGIDDVAISFATVNGLLTATSSTLTRNQMGTLGEPADDTFGFTANVTAVGSAVGTGWTTTSVTTPNATSAAYGANVVWSGFPVSGPATATFSDNLTPVLNTTLTVEPPRIIGTNDLAGGAAIIQNLAAPAWVVDETALTLTQTAATQIDHVSESAPINLSSTGFALVSADLDAIAGTSSGFEAPDSFAMEVIIDGGAPVSILGAADTNGDGRLRGAAAGPSELPDTTLVNTTLSYHFEYIIPASANSVVVRITGNSNSANETFVVKNLKLTNPPPTLQALAGAPVVNNQGTTNPGDDTFSAPVTITPVFLAPSTGWTSNSTPASGPYSDPNPVNFGPYPLAAGPVAVTLTDSAAPAVTANFTLTPPTATLAATAATNIVRNENGPGILDDTISFQTTITGSNGGPGWASTGTLPASGGFGTVTLTFPASTPSPATIAINDASYPAITQNVTVAFPGRYLVGTTYFGGATGDVLTDLATPPAAEWVNDVNARTLDMITGGATDKVVSTQTINLSAIGTVYFKANFRARETSATSNFETLDRFKAELIIDGGAPVSLISAWDTGNGAPAVGATGGPNGAPDGFINGYQGIAEAPATTQDDYNASKVRDEFNVVGGNVDATLNHVFRLSATIPSTANSVQLVITGAAISGSEFFTVSDVIFSTVSDTVDTDGDGVSDLTELADGTNPNNAASAFRIVNIGNPAPGTSTVSFPTVTGRLYQGYLSTDLVNWTKDGAALPGDGNVAAWPLIELPPPAARQFIRILNGRVETDFPATIP